MCLLSCAHQIYSEKKVKIVKTYPTGRTNRPEAQIRHDQRMKHYLDWKSKTLPFQSDSQVQEFLLSAQVISSQVIPAGINESTKYLLEKDNLRVHAVFRQVNIKSPRRSVGFERKPIPFKDSCYSELAAYELNQMLGMNNLPPAVKRMIGGRSGSLQIWLEKTMTLEARIRKGLRPSNHKRWSKQLWDMRVFDNLINNTDRNQGNILVDQDENIWLIDHTRSFAHHEQLPFPEKVTRCSHGLFRALKALEPNIVSQRLKPWLSYTEIDAVFVRRDKLVRLLQNRIAKLGDEKVLFSWPGYE